MILNYKKVGKQTLESLEEKDKELIALNTILEESKSFVSSNQSDITKKVLDYLEDIL